MLFNNLIKKFFSQKKKRFNHSFASTGKKQNFDKHNEDDYVDFYYERNLPDDAFKEGPKAA